MSNGGFTRDAALAWMRAEADVTDAGELSATKLAESCADHFDVKDEGGPLDDDGHWIWEVALEVVDERAATDDEEECDDF